MTDKGEGESVNLKFLLERVVQMNELIIGEMQQQRKDLHDHLLIGAPTSSSMFNKITLRPDKFNGTSDENVVTWLTALDEILKNRVTDDNERISLAVSLLGGTALQWYVNLAVKQQRPTSWATFKAQLINQFQPSDFQENLRHQLLTLRQTKSLADYVAAFRNLIGQVTDMDELTQVMFFTNGLASTTGLYVRAKHPTFVESAIREATTYDNVLLASKHYSVKHDPFIPSSSNLELNAATAQPSQPRLSTPLSQRPSKDECLKRGLCFYCKQPGHRAAQCSKKPTAQPSAPTTEKNDRG